MKHQTNMSTKQCHKIRNMFIDFPFSLTKNSSTHDFNVLIYDINKFSILHFSPSRRFIYAHLSPAWLTSRIAHTLMSHSFSFLDNRWKCIKVNVMSMGDINRKSIDKFQSAAMHPQRRLSDRVEARRRRGMWDVKLNQIDKLTRVKHHQIDFFHPQHFFLFFPFGFSPIRP